MTVTIRTDASAIIGTGHVMRCIALAEELRMRNARVLFICRDFPGNIADKVEQRRFEMQRLPYDHEKGIDVDGGYSSWLGSSWETDSQQTMRALEASPHIDWLVADHYSIDNRWEAELRGRVRSIFVIDDLADRKHDCDLLLDQNKSADGGAAYEKLVPGNCRLLMGPTFSLLRPEFANQRRHLKKRRGAEKRILVFWGGVDSSNQTAKTLAALNTLNLPGLSVDVVVGRNNPHRSGIEEACRAMKRTTFHYDVENMAELISRADLAVGASGVSSWERCCLGVPTIMAGIAQNQVDVGKTIHELGAGLYLGEVPKVTTEMFHEAIAGLVSDEHRLETMSRTAMNLVDGLGAQRVAAEMLA